jgi:hypothetical protein
MYCIMRTEKRKRQDIGGLQRENNRTATEYNNQVQPGMDILNVDLLHSDNWMQDIQQEIDRAGARTRSNSVVALDTIYTASGDFFKGKSNEENDQFFRDCLEFHQRKFGHVISAVIHYDETTAHMHVISVPLTRDGRLSARDVIGNRTQMRRAQTEFYEQVGRGYGLERGVQQDGPEKAQHITAQEHRLREVQQETQRELDRLGAVSHREQTERERAKRLRRQADEQQAENRRLKATASQIQGETERQQRIARQLAEMNQKARREFAQTKKQIEQMKEQASQVKGFLTIAEQRQLDELYKGDELER